MTGLPDGGGKSAIGHVSSPIFGGGEYEESSVTHHGILVAIKSGGLAGLFSQPRDVARRPIGASRAASACGVWRAELIDDRNE
jgi:hypothetical protein